MLNEQVLITGANGEIGHSLIRHFASTGNAEVVTLDLRPLDAELARLCHTNYHGDILNQLLLTKINSSHNFSKVFHLAGILSTAGEKDPPHTHNVNVNGSLNLLNLAHEQSLKQGLSVKFLFPSTIAAYGLPDIETKNSVEPIAEHEFLNPITIYGLNKLSVERLGCYYSEHYQLLSSTPVETRIDFRALRYPGIISPDTTPTGGTSDYAPEMLHAAARGEHYESFVRADTKLPFMAMSDAVRAIIELSEVPPQELTQRVYNVRAFSLSAERIRSLVIEHFPEADIEFRPGTKRQAIVDSWPADTDDRAALTDWGWKHELDAEEAFSEYLVPRIREQYSGFSSKQANL